MITTLTDFFLEFKTPFAIAHGTRDGTDIVLLKIEEEGFIGYGEASLPPYLPETQTTVREFINSFFVSGKVDLTSLENTILNLHQHQTNNYAAKACVDIALHNWFANKKGIPIYKLLGLNNYPLPLCTFTIGMDDEFGLKDKVSQSKDFKILKVKLGGDNDKKIIETLRSVTEKPLCVDVNQGWKTKEFALEMIQFLAGKNVLFVEQPLPKNNYDDQRWLFEKSPLPIIADESVQTPQDVIKIKDFYNGINVKLMKCGGISEAVKMIALARNFNLKVMVGSMSETGCAISAAAQISSLADYTDLDGPMLTRNNPFDIVRYLDGKVVVE